MRPHGQETLGQIDAAISKHKIVAVWVSGGKDSMTLLHLVRPWARKVTVIYNEVDDRWPRERENLEECCTSWKFDRLIRATPEFGFDEYVFRYGWPVEIVPSLFDGVTPSPYHTGEIKVSSWWTCSIVRFCLPVLKATKSLCADGVLTGVRASDAPLFKEDGPMKDYTTESGFVRYNPLYAWTTDQIWEYVDEHRIPLPPHYAHKRNANFEWPDCQRCTWRPEYLKWLKEHEPQKFADLWAAAGPTLRAVQANMTMYQRDLEGLLE